MFSKIRNVFESKQSPLKSPHQQEGESVGRGKLEEDGFVVVGQTADERTTVRPGDARNNEPAPDYQSLPPPVSYKQATSQEATVKASSSSPTCSGTSGVVQAIDDIPFKLHASLASALKNEVFLKNISSETQTKLSGNLSDYKYDFTLERDIRNS